MQLKARRAFGKLNSKFYQNKRNQANVKSETETRIERLSDSLAEQLP
jgi:hypothetical protein